jgi:hypothetical protein
MPTKRAQKHNAHPLPKGLTQEMLPKYVVYYHECYNKERQLFREFFKIEKHLKHSCRHKNRKGRNCGRKVSYSWSGRSGTLVRTDIY